MPSHFNWPLLTAEELDFYSRGLAKRLLSYCVQNNRSDKKVQRCKILSVSYIWFPYQNKLITLLAIQSVKYTANLNGWSVSQEVKSLSAYHTFQCPNSFNCCLLDISFILSMEFVARRHAIAVSLHTEITVCALNWELEMYWQFRLIRKSYQGKLAKLQSFRPTSPLTKLSIS